MINIGILGSSFSLGWDYYTTYYHKDKFKQRTKPLVHWFFKYTGAKVIFHNLSNAGHGSEHYLENILYLKQKFNVKKILIECVNDNRENKAYIVNKDINDILMNTENIHDMERKFTVKNLISKTIFLEEGTGHSSNSLHNELYRYADSKEEEISWIKVQQRIYDDEPKKYLFGLMHIYKSIQLCNLLDIKPYLWLPYKQHYFDKRKPPLEDKIFSSAPFLNNLIFEELPNDVSKETIIPEFKFNMLTGIINYFETKYARNEIHCDNAHLTDKYQEILVRDFLLPFIEDRYVL